ncbi:MAG: MarC family protein [Burkholderiales bacterium]|nr:MarC family protein [Burkholderiales bacterium]
MDISFGSVVVILLLVIDPFGNIPLFVAALREVAPERRMRVVAREWAIALGALLVFLFAGEGMLRLFGLSDASLRIAGGVILFLIALRMIFPSGDGIFGAVPSGEPLIFPLAVPAIAGPGAMATVILLASHAPQRIAEWVAALAVAMVLALVVLLFAERIARQLGERALGAVERLLGLILTAFAIEMLLRGIAIFVAELRG